MFDQTLTPHKTTAKLLRKIVKTAAPMASYKHKIAEAPFSTQLVESSPSALKHGRKAAGRLGAVRPRASSGTFP